MPSLGELFGIGVFAAVFIFGAVALPHALFELKFYLTNGWDLNMDSGRKMWKQDEFRSKFYSTSIGYIKLSVLCSRVAMAAMIVYESIERLPN